MIAMIASHTCQGILFPEQDKNNYRVLGLFVNNKRQVFVGKSVLEDPSELYKKNLLCAPGGLKKMGETCEVALDRWCNRYLIDYAICATAQVGQFLFEVNDSSGKKISETVLLVYDMTPIAAQVAVLDPLAYDQDSTGFMYPEDIAAHPDAPGDDRHWLAEVVESRRKVTAKFLLSAKNFRSCVMVSGLFDVKEFQLPTADPVLT